MRQTQACAANLSPPRGTPGDDSLVLTRVFDAPAETVFSLWSDPAHVAQWWQPDGYTTPVFTMDFRVGGAFRYCIVSAAGRGGLGARRISRDRRAAPHRHELPLEQWRPGP